MTVVTCVKSHTGCVDWPGPSTRIGNKCGALSFEIVTFSNFSFLDFLRARVVVVFMSRLLWLYLVNMFMKLSVVTPIVFS